MTTPGRRCCARSAPTPTCCWPSSPSPTPTSSSSAAVLDSHDAGLYAGGLILVKSLLFLPQFVIVVAFPSLSTAHARRTALTRSVALVLGLGAVGTVAAWALSGVALVFVGGQEYAEIQDQLWLFAVLGTVLSTIQLLIYSVVARQSRRTVYLVWAALVAVALGRQPGHDRHRDPRRGHHRRRGAARRPARRQLVAAARGRPGGRRPGPTPAAPATAPVSDPGSVSGFVPAVAGADRDVERHGQVGRGRHLAAHQRLQRLALPRRHLEHELVVDLQQHP